MTLFRKSLLISTSFLSIVHGTWAMKNSSSVPIEDKDVNSSPSIKQSSSISPKVESTPDKKGNVLNFSGWEKELENISNSTPQTPPQKKGNFTPQSAPPVLSSKPRNQKPLPTTPLHSSTKPREPHTDPLPTRTRNEEEIYQDQVKVAQKFLDLEKRKFISTKAHLLLIDFMNDYIFRKKSTLDITDLSARARIYLLNSIVNFKIKFLPQFDCNNNDEFKKLELSNKFWIKAKTRDKQIAEFVDQIPTTFTIGNFSYPLRLGPTLRQKGSGKLYGLFTLNSADTYDQINKKIKSNYTEGQLLAFSHLLLTQKTDGIPINTGNKADDRFLNGLNLLLDYEVARRLVNGDPFRNFPIVNYLDFIIAHLHSDFKDLIVGKKYSEWEIPFRFDNTLSLVTGDDRESLAKKFIPQLGNPQNSYKIRCALKYLHNSNEDSDGEYSGKEEDLDFLKNSAGIRHKLEDFNLSENSSDDEYSEDEDLSYPPKKQELASEFQKRGEKQEEFLKTISERYIQNLRHTDLSPQETLWGGDIELNIIASLNNLRIIVHEPFGEKFVGPEGGEIIHLWLEGGHYQNYNPITKEKTNTPMDGHCLFHGILRAMNNSNDSELNEVSVLRNQAAEHLQDLIERINKGETEEREGSAVNNWQPLIVQLTNNENPIYVRFAAIFEAINRPQLINAYMDLPPGQLREEALELKNNYSPSVDKEKDKNQEAGRTYNLLKEKLIMDLQQLENIIGEVPDDELAEKIKNHLIFDQYKRLDQNDKFLLQSSKEYSTIISIIMHYLQDDKCKGNLREAIKISIKGKYPQGNEGTVDEMESKSPEKSSDDDESSN